LQLKKRYRLLPLSSLNRDQLNAATAPFGNNLIIASAGTGKTSTIVGRIAHLLQSGVAPEEILLLTFTNKAAAEMIERVGRYFPVEVVGKIESGTFHAVSYRLLQREKIAIHLKQPNELKTLFRSVYERRDFSHIESETNHFSATFLYEQYSLFQNSAFDGLFTDWLVIRYDEHRPFFDIYEDIFEEYEALKDSYGFVNFNDLLIKMREVLHQKDFGFREVLVDEYQDTNPLQGSLIDAMNAPSLFCVGDYDQSIYGFNGSDISIIGSFATKYNDANVHTLRVNYRSKKPILDLANRVISYNERLYKKELEVHRVGVSAPPTLLVYDELFDQYKAISDRIAISGTDYEEIAVIFRNNSTADGVEASLREKGIACKRKGGRSFFDAREVKAIFDLYTLLVNANDMMAFIHVLEYTKGVGSSIAKDIFEVFVKLGHGKFMDGLFAPDLSIKNPFSTRTNYQVGLFDHDLEVGSISRFVSLNIEEAFLQNPVLKHPKLSVEGAKSLYDLYKLLKRLRKISNPKSAMRAIIESDSFSLIKDHLATKRAQQKDGSIHEQMKEDALQNITRKERLILELASPYREHRRFLNAMVLGSNDLTQGSGVNLLTIHASKGLEYKEVYIIDLMDGRFPNRKLIAKGGSVDEERRLFYVAVTRAKDTLFLSFCKHDKMKKTTFVPSLFLYEAGLIKKDEHYEKLVGE
jgi:DNA helicase-2/ATP-dependent DNA helicase PcrA